MDSEQAGGGEEEQVPQTQKGQKAKFPCLRCKKNVSKNSKSVKCNSCQFWVHIECEGISNELYNFLAHPEKYGGHVTWSCDSCQASSARIDQVVKAYAEKLRDVESRVEKTEKGMKELDRRVERIDEKVKERDDKVEKRIKNGEDKVFEELREREAKKANVVMYKVEEMRDERASGRERIDWDRGMCRKLFEVLETGLVDDDVKFCRRIGERGREPRPLVVGFYSEQDKVKLLRKAKKLDKTQYKEISICQDLTRKQREEEDELRREAEKRNEGLSEDDKAKNLRWAVVGARGEKRLVKAAARDQNTDRNSQRGGGVEREAGRGRGGRRRQRSGEDEDEPPNKR